MDIKIGHIILLALILVLVGVGAVSCAADGLPIFNADPLIERDWVEGDLSFWGQVQKKLGMEPAEKGPDEEEADEDEMNLWEKFQAEMEESTAMPTRAAPLPTQTAGDEAEEFSGPATDGGGGGTGGYGSEVTPTAQAAPASQAVTPTVQATVTPTAQATAMPTAEPRGDPLAGTYGDEDLNGDGKIDILDYTMKVAAENPAPAVPDVSELEAAVAEGQALQAQGDVLADAVAEQEAEATEQEAVAQADVTAQVEAVQQQQAAAVSRREKEIAEYNAELARIEAQNAAMRERNAALVGKFVVGSAPATDSDRMGFGIAATVPQQSVAPLTYNEDDALWPYVPETFQVWSGEITRYRTSGRVVSATPSTVRITLDRESQSPEFARTFDIEVSSTLYPSQAVDVILYWGDIGKSYDRAPAAGWVRWSSGNAAVDIIERQ